VKPSFLVIDKPVGVTSHDMVAVVRAVLGVKKVGHTGTLDPFATGVLALALGGATRLIQYLDENLKVYDATIALGTATDTGDLTGQVTRERPVPTLSDDQVLAVLAGFKGTRMQVPPRYSAVKVAGKPLYKYAREGKDVSVKARPIRIDRIELVERTPSTLRVRILCGRGTYARVLADEIATELGTAGHLVALRREQSGPFKESMALDMPGLSRIVAERDDWLPVLRPKRGAERVQWRPRSSVQADIARWLVPTAVALDHLPGVTLSDGQLSALRRSGQLPAPPASVQQGQRFLCVHGKDVVVIASREADGVRKLVTVAGG